MFINPQISVISERWLRYLPAFTDPTSVEADSSSRAV